MRRFLLLLCFLPCLLGATIVVRGPLVPAPAPDGLAAIGTSSSGATVFNNGTDSNGNTITAMATPTDAGTLSDGSTWFLNP